MQNSIPQSHLNALAAKVKAVNIAHQTLDGSETIVKNYFTSFVGKKIVKATGEFMVSFKEGLPALPSWKENNKINCYYKISFGSVYVNITVHEYYETFGWKGETQQTQMSYETQLYIGEISGQILTKVNEKLPAFPQYDFEHVKENLLKVKKIKDELWEAEKLTSTFNGMI